MYRTWASEVLMQITLLKIKTAQSMYMLMLKLNVITS